MTFDASYITPPVDYTITHNFGLSGIFKNFIVEVIQNSNGFNSVYTGGTAFYIKSFSSNSFVMTWQLGNWNQVQTLTVNVVKT